LVVVTLFKVEATAGGRPACRGRGRSKPRAGSACRGRPRHQSLWLSSHLASAWALVRQFDSKRQQWL